MSTKYIWYGHGTHGIGTAGLNILVDPFLTGNPVASITAKEVPADYILVSHGHGDHIGDAEVVSRRTGAQIITNFEVGNWLEAKGLPVHKQHIGGGFMHPFGYLKLTLALHGSGLPDGSYGGNPVGFLLTTLDGKKIYLACDTGIFSDMVLIGEEGIDLAVLPIGDNYTMGPGDAIRAVKLLQPKHVVPVHYNTFELINQDADAWAQRVSSETDATPHVLDPGDELEL